MIQKRENVSSLPSPHLMRGGQMQKKAFKFGIWGLTIHTPDSLLRKSCWSAGEIRLCRPGEILPEGDTNPELAADSAQVLASRPMRAQLIVRLEPMRLENDWVPAQSSSIHLLASNCKRSLQLLKYILYSSKAATATHGGTQLKLWIALQPNLNKPPLFSGKSANVDIFHLRIGTSTNFLSRCKKASEQWSHLSQKIPLNLVGMT